MSKNNHALIQILAIVLQLLNVLSGTVPAKYQPIIAGLLAAAQAAVALYNHSPVAPVV
jgi:hypothetical protein